MLDYKAGTPEKLNLKGNFITLEPLSVDKHGDDLWSEVGKDEGIWKYLFNGPFESKQDFLNWLKKAEENPSRVYYTCINQKQKALGSLSFMDINPEHGRLEIGGIFFGKSLQRTTMSTESIFLLMQYAFDELGYRRVEWKCNSLNEPSKMATERFGFTLEGTLRNHMVTKGKNRDTLVFSCINEEWPQIKNAFEEWLNPENFTENGIQKTSLKSLMQLNKSTTNHALQFNAQKPFNSANLQHEEQVARVDLNNQSSSESNKGADIKAKTLSQTNEASVNGKACNSLL